MPCYEFHQTHDLNRLPIWDRGVCLKHICSTSNFGVIFESTLGFSQHTTNICNRALRTLGFAARNAQHFLNARTLLLLYKSLVRPILEFSSVVWTPYTANVIREIEVVQHKFLCFLALKCGLAMPCIYHDYVGFLQLRSLQAIRLIADMNLLYGVLNG